MALIKDADLVAEVSAAGVQVAEAIVAEAADVRAVAGVKATETS